MDQSTPQQPSRKKSDPLAHRSGGAHRHRLLDLPAPLGRDLCRAGTAAPLAGTARAGRGPDLPGAGRSGQLGHHPQPDARLHRAAGAGIVVHGHLRQRHLPGCRCHADAVLLPLPQRPAAWPRRGPDDPAIRLPQDHRSALRHRDAVAAAPVARRQHLRRDELSAHGLCRGGRHHRGAGAGLRIAPHPAAGPLGVGLPAQDCLLADPPGKMAGAAGHPRHREPPPPRRQGAAASRSSRCTPSSSF